MYLTGGLSRTRTGYLTFVLCNVRFLVMAVMVNRLVFVVRTIPVYLMVLRLQVLVPIMVTTCMFGLRRSPNVSAPWCSVFPPTLIYDY